MFSDLHKGWRMSPWKMGYITVFILLGGPHASAGAADSFVDSIHIPTPLSYEDCLDARKKLFDEAGEVGEQAWQIVRASRAFTTPESNSLYQKAARLRDEGWALHCMWTSARQPDNKDEPEGYSEKALDRLWNHIKEKSMERYPRSVREIVEKNIEAIEKHRREILGALSQLAIDVDGPAFSNGRGTSESPIPSAKTIKGSSDEPSAEPDDDKALLDSIPSGAGDEGSEDSEGESTDLKSLLDSVPSSQSGWQLDRPRATHKALRGRSGHCTGPYCVIR